MIAKGSIRCYTAAGKIKYVSPEQAVKMWGEVEIEVCGGCIHKGKCPMQEHVDYTCKSYVAK